jgi:hypothetical protein
MWKKDLDEEVVDESKTNTEGGRRWYVRPLPRTRDVLQIDRGCKVSVDEGGRSLNGSCKE